MSADPHQDVHQGLIRWRAVNGGAQRLDEPRPRLRGAEAVVIPERGLVRYKSERSVLKIVCMLRYFIKHYTDLEDQKVNIVWYLVSGCAVSAGVAPPPAVHR